MTEADHYGPLWQGANSEGWHLFRIADGSVGKKPADIMGCSPNGFGVIVEVKSGIRRANWRADSPHWPDYAVHQKAWLRLYAEASAISLAAEYDELQREMRIFMITSVDQVHEIVSPTPVYSCILPKIAGIYIGWHQILYAHDYCRLQQMVP